MNGTNLVEIREERPEDASEIRRVVQSAFADHPFSDQTEHRIVDALRAAGALTVSLVATVDDQVVGHVAISPIRIQGESSNWHGLGPVAVAPSHQNRGLGSRLVRTALQRLQAFGSRGCVVLGDPAFYACSGFRPASTLFYPGPPAEYFQALAFGGDEPTGEVEYHPAFQSH